MRVLNKLRNKILMVLTFVLVSIASFGLFSFCTIDSVDAGMIKFDNETNVSISNGSFTNYSSTSSYPRPLNNYTTEGNKTISLKSGAINVEKSVYKSKYNEYGLTADDNPYASPYIYDSRSDDYVLMINSNNSCRYGYISEKFTFKANGHYYVTVSVYTVGDGGIASVYLLKDGVIFEDCKLENISTSNSWCNYTFYVSTNSYEDVTLNFAMYLGGLNSQATGCVFFDDLHAGQISEDTLKEAVVDGVEMSTAYVYSDNRHAYNEYALDTYFTENEGGTGDKYALYKNGVMNLSATDSYVLYKGQEEVLDANTTYRFSINVKVDADLTSGSAFVKLEEILDEDSTITAKNSKLTVSSKTTNSINNGWVEYIIYVCTGANESSKVKFSFGVGDADTSATGSASFKTYRIERVPYSAYNSASTGSSVGKFNISEHLTLNGNQYSNHTFDKMTSNKYEGSAYPATASNWTLTSGEGYQVSGIVNLEDFANVLNENKGMNTISTPSSWGTETNNNVLMIYNGEQSIQSYTSSSKNLDANKYYRITVFVNSISVDNGASVLAKLKSGNNEATILKVENIITNNEWQRVEFIIHTPSNSVDLYLELALGYSENHTASGYAFFDNIMLESSDNDSTFTFDYSKYTLAGKKTIDLNDSMQSLTSSKDYNAPMFYEGKIVSGENANAGIVNLENSLTSIIAPSKQDALKSLEGVNKVLAISSTLNADTYYTLTSLLTYNFESGKYYKFSIKVFTDGIGQEEKEEMQDNGVLAQGVGVELTELEDAKFNYIVSDGKWTTYEIYINPNETCISNLVLSLGSDFTGCYGKGFFGDIQLTEIDENVFNAQVANDTTLVVSKVAEENEETTEESDEGNKTNFSWAYIPTILTFLAIVVAVIAVFVRRNIKFKKRVKNGKVNYDRDTTVMKNKYHRLASDRRDKEVRELTKECEELIALRTEYEEKYKEALSKLRSAKLANRDGSKRHEIMAIEREVKHISKEVARYGVQVNNYESEIEFMQTEGYLMDLEKRMMREDTNARNQLKEEALMTEEERKALLEKREQKLAKDKEKAENKARKLAEKQQMLKEEREDIERQKQEAIEKDALFMQEKELKRIKAEEDKLAKEKAKSEKELSNIKEEEKEVKQESEKLANVGDTDFDSLTEDKHLTETSEDANDVANEDAEEKDKE